MNHAYARVFVIATIAASTFGVSLIVAQESAQDAEQRVAALKKSLAENQAKLRKYEWVETTTVSLKGEEKSRKQMRCYYGADGKVQKLPVGDPPQGAQSGGGRRGGRLKEQIVESKKNEMQEYMERAAALVHQYVPPNPADIDSAKKTGKLALRPGQGGSAQLEFTSYLKPGDTMTINVDGAANRLAGVSVNSYLDSPDDAVTLNVAMNSLPDGTTYTAQTTLDAKAKNIRVVIQNAGYKPMAQ